MSCIALALVRVGRSDSPSLTDSAMTAETACESATAGLTRTRPEELSSTGAPKSCVSRMCQNFERRLCAVDDIGALMYEAFLKVGLTGTDARFMRDVTGIGTFVPRMPRYPEVPSIHRARAERTCEPERNDVDELARRLEGRILHPPKLQPWGMYDSPYPIPTSTSCGSAEVPDDLLSFGFSLVVEC